MKKAIAGVIIIMALAAAAMAEDQAQTAPVAVTPTQDAAAPAKKRVFMKVGAVEKVENDKFTMRQTETRYEFFLDEKTKIFLRSESAPGTLQEKNYLVIKGPKNKKVVLANSVYIYDSRDEYEGFADKKEENPDDVKRVFSAVLEGTMKQKDPLIIRLADGTEYTVSYDEDTYWILTKKADKEELKPGERIKLFFDKLYTIRYKNYPVKIVVDRVKAGF
jgi:hypothetical protein